MEKNNNSSNKRIYIVILGIFIVVIIAIILNYVEKQEKKKQEEAKKGIQITYYKCSYCSTEIRRDTTNIKLSKPAQTPTDKEIHKDDYSKIHDHCKEPYALTLMDNAKSYLDNKKYAQAIETYDRIQKLSNEVYEKNKLKDIKSKAVSELNNIQMEKAKEKRKLYAERLRESYLDRKMDIKVEVSGTHNEYLVLIYALFNDVWVHEFKKGSLIEEIEDQGFECVMFSDGYKYANSIWF